MFVFSLFEQFMLKSNYIFNNFYLHSNFFQILGNFYWIRWYLGLKNDADEEPWDRGDFGFRNESQPDTFYFHTFYR